MQRRTFIEVLSASAAGALLSGSAKRAEASAARRLNRVGLELYSVRHAMKADPERTLAAVRAAGYKDVELLWSMDNFGRSVQQVKASLKQEGLRAPSAHISQSILTDNWGKHLDDAHLLGMTYLIVPNLDDVKTLDDWRRWSDTFNTAGAAARKAGLWLAFHNEPDHMKPIDGQVPYDDFIQRLDPKVVRLQLDVGNMIMGGGDPMAYLKKHRDRYWSFHLKDVVPDKSSDTEIGKGTVNFKQLLAAVPNINAKPCYVEQEGAKDELASARENCAYLRKLNF